MATVEVLGVRDVEIRRRILGIRNDFTEPGRKVLQVGSVSFLPDTIVATWTRERLLYSAAKSTVPWRMVALAVIGSRIVKGELREEAEFRVEHRYGRDLAPKWVVTLAERYIPTDSF